MGRRGPRSRAERDALAKGAVVSTGPATGPTLLLNRMVEVAREDPVIFAAYVMGWEPCEMHREWHGLMNQHNRGVLFGFRESAKCLVTGRVGLASGEWVGPREANGREVVVLDPASMERRVALATVEDNGRKPCLRLTLRSGRTLEVTRNHPLFTVKGWAEASEIGAGSYVAGAREVPEGTGRDLTIEEAEFAGYVVGDGGVTQHCVRITAADPGVVERLEHLARHFGWGLHKDSGKYAYRFNNNHLRIGSAQELVGRLGLLGKNSYTKRVPKQVFRSSNEVVSAFVGAYFACDGTVSMNRGGGMIFASVSRDLLADVQLLLLRFGIQSRVNEGTTTCKGKRFRYWRLTVTGREFVEKFRDRIVVHGAKRARMDGIVLARTPATQCDVVPKEWISAHPGATQMVLHRAGILDWKQTKLGQHRDRVRRVLAFAPDDHVARLADDAICWDQVQSVEDMGMQRTWALEVHDPAHCFLDSGLLSHNSQQLTILRTLWELGRDPTLNFGIIANTAAQSQARGKQLRELITYSAALHRVFPELWPGDPDTVEMLSVRARPKGTSDYSIRCFGTYGPIRQSRLHRIICDDICDLGNTLTEGEREKLYNWIKGEVIGVLLPGGKMWLVGNALHREDVLHRLQGEGWPTFKYTVDYKEDVRDEETGALVHEKGDPRFPGQWTRERIAEMREIYGPLESARQLECEARDDTTAVFKGAWIAEALARGVGKERGESGIIVHLDPASMPAGTLTITAADLGASKNRRSDLTALTDIWVKPERHRRVMDVEAGKWDPAVIAAKIGERQERYKSQVWVENVGQQGLLINNMESMGYAAVRSHHTGTTEPNLVFEALELAWEMSRGMWTFPAIQDVHADGRPSGPPRAANSDVERLCHDLLNWVETDKMPDRMQSLCIGRSHCPRKPYWSQEDEDAAGQLDVPASEMYVEGGKWPGGLGARRKREVYDPVYGWRTRT